VASGEKEHVVVRSLYWTQSSSTADNNFVKRDLLSNPLLVKLSVALSVALFGVVATSEAARVADVTRIGGQRTNVLTGMGLVIGLKGTGDGGKFMPAIEPLAQMLLKFSNQTSPGELKDASNVAVVMLTVTVPENGARDGDAFDVYVSSIGAAQSLRGGRLFVTPLMGPMADGHLFALAQGAVVLEDTSTPTVGIVRKGCVMEVDLPAQLIDQNSRFTLVIDDAAASWTLANTIAKVINSEGGEGSVAAVALDPKNVVVTIPVEERGTPDAYISRIQRLPIPIIASEARVQINDRTGTIIITGDVEISPVIISHRGLTISTVSPQPVPSPRTPVVSSRDFVAVDPQNTGGAKLRDLLVALDQLKVPAEERISILKELHKTGKLHAKLEVE